MNCFWRISDGRIWSSERAAFVDNVPEGETVTPLYANGEPAGLDFLRDTIRFYGTDPGELKTPDEYREEFTAAIQNHLDAFAQTRNFDGIMSAATYATSTVSRFRAEGQYAVEARDATWDKAYAILDEVISGARPMPTIDEVLAELPPLAWPEVSA